MSGSSSLTSIRVILTTMVAFNGGPLVALAGLSWATTSTDKESICSRSRLSATNKRPVTFSTRKRCWLGKAEFDPGSS